MQTKEQQAEKTFQAGKFNVTKFFRNKLIYPLNDSSDDDKAWTQLVLRQTNAGCQ